MKTATYPDEIKFRMTPSGHRVEVLCGLPFRERDLALYVPFSPGVSKYMWGRKCGRSMELARAILTFTLTEVGADVEVPDELVVRFVNEVVSCRSSAERWDISMTEVFEWLAK